MLEVVPPREDANTEFGLLTEWLVGDGEPVQRKQLVCVFETTKASIEIEAPGDGTLVHLCAAGSEFTLGKRVALIAESADELAAALADRDASTRPPAVAGQRKATRRAVELAEEHGIEIDAIEKQGFVTAEDIEALVSARRGRSEPSPGGADLLAGVSTDGVTLPSSFGLGPDVGALDGGFLTALGADEHGFRALSSAEKIAAYREHGAEIGEGVVLGDGTLLVAPRIVLADGVRLGPGATVRCADVIAIGRETAFGPNLEISCRRAFLGAGIWGGRSVRFGGGGHREPWAILAVGNLTFVGDETFVNVCRPVLIGREAFVTMRSMIVTHNIGHSVLEGYENRFAPVVLEDRSQLGLGAVVYAGCRIGHGAIVASNSYVVSDIPADTLAIGVPARASGSARHIRSPARIEELAREMVRDLHELLALRDHAVSPVEGTSVLRFTLETEAGTSSVTLVPRLDASEAVPRAEVETVVLTLDLATRAPDGVTVFDLVARHVDGPGGPLHDAVREFCRKRGIRLTPEPWRYLGGLL